MNTAWLSFHDPDISWPIVGRRVTEELIDMIFGAGLLVLSRGRMITHGGMFPSRDAAYMAVTRLKKKGLIVEEKTSGFSMPRLTLSNEGTESVSACLQPYRRWKHKWRGRWYVLVYDVPEKDRPYREVLRSFLKKQKMGQLQRSVWVTPFDIRPLYNDLVEGSNAGQVSYLFEARTVLGLPSQEIVTHAWNFKKLTTIQTDFCRACRRNHALLQSGKIPDHALFSFSRDAFITYRHIMEMDPLLPKDLWPEDYLGEEVYSRHRALQEEIHSRLNENILLSMSNN